jgi:flagellar basal-body rod modification protein FlgD
MDPSIQSKFKPFESPSSRDFSSAKVGETDPKAIDSTDKDKDRVAFKDLLLNSNDDIARTRAAQKNGDELRMAKTDAEFSKMLADRANQGNLRKPQNELDKDAFLKLFVTQMRNQDPLNPDNSAQMAAQLAQFHGLEQMMNVNKNLEKMQGEQALGRAVGLIGFVGKEIKLDNGKLMFEGGKLTTQASFKLDTDAAKTGVEVRDASGVVVASQVLGPQTAGDHPLTWDGLGKDGKPLANGAYTFNVIATDVRGEPVASRITSTVKVTGVDLQNGGSFYTPVGKIGVNEVASVGENGFSQAAAKADQSAADAAKAALAKAELAKAEVPGEDAPKDDAAKAELPKVEAGAESAPLPPPLTTPLTPPLTPPAAEGAKPQPPEHQGP